MTETPIKNEVPEDIEERDHRFVGFKMSQQTAFAWADKLSNAVSPPIFDKKLDWNTPKYEDHGNVLDILEIQLNKAKEKHGIKEDVVIRPIGESGDADFMVITRKIKFEGYENMPIEEVPQEEKNEHDQNVENWLRAEGEENWVFVTIVG